MGNNNKIAPRNEGIRSFEQPFSLHLLISPCYRIPFHPSVYRGQSKLFSIEEEEEKRKRKKCTYRFLFPSIGFLPSKGVKNYYFLIFLFDKLNDNKQFSKKKLSIFEIPYIPPGMYRRFITIAITRFDYIVVDKRWKRVLYDPRCL